MTDEQYRVLQGLYRLEEDRLQANAFDVWTRPVELAAALPPGDPLRGDAAGVRRVLESLWVARKVLQVPDEPAEAGERQPFELDGRDAHGAGQHRLATEASDCRGPAAPYEEAALYGPAVKVRYRSRVAEVTRLLASNYQRFNMAPATGLARYVRRRQERPAYDLPLTALLGQLRAEVRAGHVEADAPAGREPFPLTPATDRARLERALAAVLEALSEQFTEAGHTPNLADFQARSLRATLAGLYSPAYRQRADAHVITTGVGSGKTYAFQLGALVHVGYQAVAGQRGLQVLLLYPRVVLAANQFQDLTDLVGRVAARLGVRLRPPILDAGGQLPGQLGYAPDEAGRTFNAIREAYKGDFQILISNLDTLANRLAHPEAFRGLTEGLDLVVLDEVHILRGLYGAHARMLLKRLRLLRALCRVRTRSPAAPFEQLLAAAQGEPGPYLIAASATVAEPARHTARVLDLGDPARVGHLDVGAAEATGWVHHLFLRQRPEVSSMSAVTNATSCLIHNRRDGLFREHYQRRRPAPDGRVSLALTDLPNPCQPAQDVEPRRPEDVHKTVGFCDSLDGVGRWANLVADNERTKASEMGTTPTLARLELPYFLRFQEPLWRAVHHLGFGPDVRVWQRRLWAHYGELCRDCKRGCKRRAERVPTNLNQAGRRAVERLWDFSEGNDDSYLGQLDVDRQFRRAPWFVPLHDAAREETIGNLDECPFFRTGLCWWWSMDHLGSNHPSPATASDPLNGYKQPRRHPRQLYHFVNAVRVRWFTSVSEFDAFAAGSINDLFQDRANAVFRDGQFGTDDRETCSLLIGSPRIEVGIDLDRVTEGITYRALRDPASIQQKTGRVGRELHSDSVVVHLVTENARDHYYFRNPRVALDPAYLQPIPLHESNRIVARQHLFMALFDFFVVQGLNPPGQEVPGGGDRILLLNDQRNPPQPQIGTYYGWDAKLTGLWAFLFGGHARQAVNLANLHAYLNLLGARPDEITNPAEAALLTPGDTPLSRPVGAVDVFRHDFGPDLLQASLTAANGRRWTLAQFCAFPRQPPALQPLAGLPRHASFVESLRQLEPFKGRSYLHNLLKLPVFRRGVPSARLPGNQPFLWTPTLFEAVGNETVCVNQERRNQQGATYLREGIAYEGVSLALALLMPGAYTYRYGPTAYKVAVGRYAAQGLRNLGYRLEGVLLRVDDPDHYEAAANCLPLQPPDLPPDFPSTGQAVPVYTPRQVHLVWVPDQPKAATTTGLVADNDAAPAATGTHTLPTPPRTFALRWYRVACSGRLEEVPCRLAQRYAAPAGQPPLPRQPWPAVCSLFTAVEYDPELEVTDFVWGLDQQFTNRQVEPARLVYRAGGEAPTLAPVALGRHYRTPGLRFTLDLRPGSPLDAFLADVGAHTESGLHQTLVLQVLHAFLAEYARTPLAGGAPWEEPARPSVFTVRNVKAVVVFHLVERWHPAPQTGQAPAAPPAFTLADLQGCFTPGHANYLDRARFQQVCGWLAAVQNPASPADRFATLDGVWPSFEGACGAAGQLTTEFFKRTVRDLLLNTLGLTAHTAALRLTGAEDSDLDYFYRLGDDGLAHLFLFDTDDLGNGTADVVRDLFFVSPAERVLDARRRALGDNPDPLPSTDFVRCLEEQLQECASSQAAHLAYHDLPAAGPLLADLDGARQGERQTAGRLFDFLRGPLRCASFDHTAFLQASPEFVAHLGGYPLYRATALVGSPEYPTFQALESAVGYCLCGCVNCVTAPEQNLHGILNAKDTVNKLLLDACYRRLVCEAGTAPANLAYPAAGPARSAEWGELALVVSATLGVSSGGQAFVVAVPTPQGAHTLTVIPCAVPAGWERVFRTGWAPASPPRARVRPRMIW